MKKSLITLALVACTVTAFAQGQCTFQMRITGSLLAPVYLPELSDPTIELHGNSATGIPAGTTVYTGGVIPAAQGANFSAQLFGGPLGTTDASLLQAATPATTFRTSASLAGLIIAVPVTLPNVAVGATATLQARAWDNKGGQVTSWAAAEALSRTDSTYRLGDSLLFDSPVLKGPPDTPTDTANIRSFNLHTVVPEPSTIALGVLGLGALVLFRRRK